MLCSLTVLAAAVLYSSRNGALVQAIPTAESVGSDLRLLFQNDLDWRTTAEHTSTILLSSRTNSAAITACSKLSESLLTTNGTFFSSDTKHLIQYLALNGGAAPSQNYWVSSTDSTSKRACTAVSTKGLSSVDCDQSLPAFCSNSAPNKISGQTDLSPEFQVQVSSGNITFTGTRDHLSFRFLGIPYANFPERFTYSHLYTGTSPTSPGTNISALSFGSPCIQVGGTGNEDCLFLNIFTPLIPISKTPRQTELKPVMFWIHGGAFTSGEGSDAIFDGGNLVSRGDVVVVTINYRLGALGFLALEDGVTNGNFGIADQITALNWVKAHIATFGGDPSRVTIFGQSAGAGSVRALLAAPPAFGLFAGAIAQSNLDGFAFASTYSNYFTIPEEVNVTAAAFLNDVGCAAVNGTSGDAEVLECLREIDASVLQNDANAPKFIVVDGHFITTDQLVLNGSVSVAPAHVIFGWMADDGTDFAGSFPTNSTNQAASVEGIGISADIAGVALDSGLFPAPSTGNETMDIFNVTSRVSTDGQFLCLDQATVFSAAKHRIFNSVWAYQFDRSYMGFEPIPGICDPPATETHPFGDPTLPYFRCHSGELFFNFGTLGQSVPGQPFRDSNDLVFSQIIVDQWASFARSFDPNPSTAFLQARGYTNTTEALKRDGKWLPVGSIDGLNGTEEVRLLDVPSRGVGWMEQGQCGVLGFPVTFYESK